jgi:hypothetical protein
VASLRRSTFDVGDVSAQLCHSLRLRPVKLAREPHSEKTVYQEVAVRIPLIWHGTAPVVNSLCPEQGKAYDAEPKCKSQQLDEDLFTLSILACRNCAARRAGPIQNTQATVARDKNCLPHH